MKLLDIKKPLIAPADALFYASLEAAVASDVDCRMAYARCLETQGAQLDEAKAELARRVHAWLERMVEGMSAQALQPKTAPACDCGGAKAKTLHAQWCATITGVAAPDARAEPAPTEALVKGVERYKRKVARLEAELAEKHRWAADVNATAAKRHAIAELRKRVMALETENAWLKNNETWLRVTDQVQGQGIVGTVAADPEWQPRSLKDILA